MNWDKFGLLSTREVQGNANIAGGIAAAEGPLSDAEDDRLYAGSSRDILELLSTRDQLSIDEIRSELRRTLSKPTTIQLAKVLTRLQQTGLVSLEPGLDGRDLIKRQF